METEIDLGNREQKKMWEVGSLPVSQGQWSGERC